MQVTPEMNTMLTEHSPDDTSGLSIKVPMMVRLYAGDVLVAEVDDSQLFSAALNIMLPKRCALCQNVPNGYCCLQQPTQPTGE